MGLFSVMHEEPTDELTDNHARDILGHQLIVSTKKGQVVSIPYEVMDKLVASYQKAAR